MYKVTAELINVSNFLGNLNISGAEYHKSLMKLPKLIDDAQARIKNSPFDLNRTYIGHSGGKDSVAIHYLASQVRSDFVCVHTPKVSGPNKVNPITIQFLYSLNFPIYHIPSNSHNSLNLDTQIDGTRIAEWNREDGRSQTFVNDGHDISRENLTEYVKNGLFGLNFIYPIYDWSDSDVWALILSKRLEFSGEYLWA